MKAARKRDFPVEKIRRYLEPGPVVLVSSSWKGRSNIMTLGWHLVMAFSPSRVGCVIDAGNHSFRMIRKSRECVINIPDARMVDTVVGIGNCSGDEVDKFERFGLTAVPGTKVAAPLVGECFANLECRLDDTRLVRAHDFFVFEVVKAHVAVSLHRPRTLHYHGGGIFHVSGDVLSQRRKFTKWRGAPNF